MSADRASRVKRRDLREVFRGLLPDGSYIFSNLPVLPSGQTYQIQETQPSSYNDGKETVGSLGGSASTSDKFTAISRKFNG